MRRALAMLLLMAGTLVPAISASAQSQNGGVGIRLLEAPTAREKDPRARRSIVDHVKPGASFSRKFEVSNTTSGQRLISIYAAAADVVGGQFVPADGRTQNELSGWITLDTNNADLPAGGTVQPRLTITVPPTATEGERYAVIWAELPPATPPAGGVAVVNRVGLRVYLSVGAGGEPATDFVIESLTAERDAQKRPVVQATVKNTGGRALDLSGNLRLTNGPGGLSAGPFDARLGTTLAIGASAPVTIPLDPSLPDGPWDARIELRSSTTVRTAEATITFPAAAGATASPVAADPVEEKSSSSMLPVLLAVGGGVLLLLLLLFLLLRRRSSAPPTVALPLDDVLTELRTAEGKRRTELMGMAAAYGKEAIMASPALAALPVQTARDLGERVAKTGR
ncbi:MAG TPA: peptidase [Frankiaceae bacterium]|nr:peptidase [Frankiaceae bacterium]